MKKSLIVLFLIFGASSAFAAELLFLLPKNNSDLPLPPIVWGQRDSVGFGPVKGGSGYVVERRVHNGNVASGVRVRLSVTKVAQGDNMLIKLSPTGMPAEAYQEGMSEKLDVPQFSEEDAIKSLIGQTKSFAIEIDSPYPADAVKEAIRRFSLANWIELEGKYFMKGGHLVKSTQAYFDQKVIPYRNGSKAIFNVKVPMPAPNPNGVIDYLKVLPEIEAKLRCPP